MRTMPRRLSTTHPRGDYRCLCAYCGVLWHRSRLRKDAAGLLACPDDARGRDQVTLNRLNAANARRRRPSYRHDGGGTDPTSGGDP